MDFPALLNLKGLIFDLDGTLINSMPTHIRAWQQTAKEHGFSFSEQVIYDMGGVSSRDVVDYFASQGFEVGDRDEFVKRKVALYRSHLDGIRTFPKVEALLRSHKEAGLKIAVGTGTQRINAESLLGMLGLRDFIDAVVTGDDVTRHKPFPDTFLKAAQELGLPVTECAVFEDGPLGVKAALNGGFVCVEVKNGECIKVHSPQG